MLKGASEIVLGVCSHFINDEGEVTQLNDVVKSSLDNVITKFAQDALRTICVAYKDIKEGECG